MGRDTSIKFAILFFMEFIQYWYQTTLEHLEIMMREKEGWCACGGASDKFADTMICLHKVKFKKNTVLKNKVE